MHGIQHVKGAKMAGMIFPHSADSACPYQLMMVDTLIALAVKLLMVFVCNEAIHYVPRLSVFIIQLLLK